MKNFLILIFVLLCGSVFAQKIASLSIKFDNFIGSEPVSLNNKTYKNASNEEFNITLLQYYVSNIQLVRKDGSVYTVPQDDSYFLVRESNTASKTITLNNIPKGKYTGISFVIGIDSARSAAEIAYRKGCLDVAGEARDMYWAWNSGYIFVKMEGTSAVSTEDEHVFLYHIGLFGGIGDKKTLNNIKNANLSFGNEILKVKAGKTMAQVQLKADASKIMNGTTTISIAKNPSIMGGPNSAKIADNYQSMFSFGGIGIAPAPKNNPVTLGMN